jgi:hypothetical protein
MPDDTKNARILEFENRLQKCTLFYWRHFRFPDGKVRNKYLLVLSKNPKESDLICVLPTSKTDDYGPSGRFGPEGARRDVLLIKQGECEHFPRNTILDFTSRTEITRNELKRAYVGRKAEIKGRLEDEIVKAIDGIIKDAYTISDREKERIV